MYSSGKNLVEREMEGSSLEACKDALYKRYGVDYQIMDYKTIIKPGFLHLHQHEMYKVKYVVKDNRFDDFAPARTPAEQWQSTPKREVSFQGGMATVPGGQSVTAGLSLSGSSPEPFSASKEKLLEKLGGSNVVTSIQLNNMSKKIDAMQSALEKFASISSVKEEHETIVKIEELLEQNEFTASYIEEIKDRIRNEFNLEELDDEQLVKDQVADWIGEDIQIAPRFEERKPPHVIIIVGPTGVGKTTTIAKMAAEIKMTARDSHARNPVIHMITTDTMRVAAKEQLEHYAEVMDLEVEKTSGREDLEKLIKFYNSPSVNFVFIDTSGFSPNDYEHIKQLQETLDIRNLHADIYLAVTATTKARDLERIIQNYSPFGFRSVIITKCDETSTYGNVLSVLHEKGKKISWITVGQEVLHNMERANPCYFLKNLDGFDLDEEHIEKKFGKVSE